MKKTLLLACITGTSFTSISQANWQKGGNTIAGGTNSSIGTKWNSDFYIMTNNRFIAQFTSGNGLNTAIVGNSGDGLRIRNQTPLGTAGNLDLYTSYNSGENETHIVFGGNGQISGQNNRLEERANSNGFYFNTETAVGMYKFSRSNIVTGFIGTNNYWRIGAQTESANINAARRLEVADDTWQFRISRNNGAAFTDFQTRLNGRLNINPSGGMVGINLPAFAANPTATIDVNGNARIRSVQDLTNPDALIVGKRNIPGTDDYEIRSLDFNGDATTFLNGTGNWTTIPTPPVTNTANNGVSISALNEIQLGVPCNVNGQVNFPGIFNSRLTEDRIVYNQDQHFWFATGNDETGGVGIGGQFIINPFCETANTLEISANMNNAKYGNTDASGLRFTKLTSFSPTVSVGTNGVNNTKVLTVDKEGDVVLTDVAIGSVQGAHNGTSMSLLDPSKVSFGNDFGSPLKEAKLLNDREVPLNDFNIHFTGDGSGNSNTITVGNLPGSLNALPNGFAKLVVHSGLNTVTNLISTNQNSYGIYSQNLSHANNGIGEMIGIYGGATGVDVIPNKGVHIGGDFEGNNGWIFNIGVRGRTDKGYGVYGETPSGSGWAGYFNGDVEVDGVLTIQGSIVTASDQMFKTNVNDMTNSMDLINQLSPKTYLLDTINFAQFNFDGDQQMGLIAQDVELVLPAIVSNHTKPAVYDSLGNIVTPAFTYKGVEYEELIPLLISGMKEQQSEIDSKDSLINNLNDRLASLENCLSGILPFLCQLNHSSIQQTDSEIQQSLIQAINVELRNNENIVLNQNVPNPFAESTVINYSVPASVVKAEIMFYDGNGSLLKTILLTERGAGSINVYGSDLSSGVYTYSLVADGQIVSTKRMVKQ